MLSNETIEAYRKMTPGQRLKVVFDMIDANWPYMVRGTPEQVARRFELIRRENDERSVFDVAKHVGAEQPGHLHVEKDQFWLQRRDRSRGRLAVRRLSDDFNPIECRQHAFEPGAGNRLVVDDEG